MWEDSFSLNPFTWGLGSYNQPTGTSVPAGTASSGQPRAGTQTTSFPPGTPWYQILLTSGLDAYKSFLNTDVAETQIAAGQYPSQNAIIPNLNAATSSLTSLLPVVVVVIIVVMIARFAFGGHRR